MLFGLFFIAIGIWVFRTPLASYLTLAMLFSISFIVSGLSEIVFSISNKDELENWGWTLTSGILTLLMGGLLIMNPGVSVVTLPFYVGFVILFRSIGAISFSLDLKSYGVLDWGYLMGIGLLGVLFAFILLWNPLFGGMSVVIWTGLAFIIAGVYSCYFSLKLKKLHDVPNKLSNALMKKYDELESEIKKELANQNQLD
jgi:uncharacterized membrane protein HdeD (DUF308 family)